MTGYGEMGEEGEVRPLRPAKTNRQTAEQQQQQWRRRQAVLILGYLPENTSEALAILRLAEELLQTWMPTTPA